MSIAYRCLGFTALGLGIVGAFLPLLPTTGFILLAAWSFSKSSQKWHTLLLNHQLFGPLIQQWQQQRCIPQKAKILAIASILLSGTYSLWMLNHHLAQTIFVMAMALGIYALATTKKCTL